MRGINSVRKGKIRQLAMNERKEKNAWTWIWVVSKCYEEMNDGYIQTTK